MDPADPYEALAALIARELDRVTDGDLTALAAHKAERAQIVRALPLTPPSTAGPALARCAELQARVRAQLEWQRANLLDELRELRTAQRAAAGYRPAIRRGHAVSAAA